MHDTALAVGEQRFDVTGITRVEGEGSLRLTVRDGQVVRAHLAIFEAPRYFEQLVLGRTPDEVLDIVARICRICPIAYQMSAVHAFEDLFAVTIDPATRVLRRLLYCGEWIESHALHVYLLHAPDFAGVANAIELANLDRAAVERGLAIKRTEIAWYRSSAGVRSTRSACGSEASRAHRPMRSWPSFGRISTTRCAAPSKPSTGSRASPRPTSSASRSTSPSGTGCTTR